MERRGLVRQRSRASRISVVTAAIGLLLSLVAAPAAADDGKDGAKTAFAQGRTLFESGQYAEAAKAFRGAYALAPHWKVLYNIGQCEAAAKRYGPALDAFEQYLAEGGDEVDAERRDEVLAEIDRLRKMVGGVDIEAPVGSVVLVDGEERGRTPLPGRLRLSAGVEHLLVIRLGEEALLSRKVRVGSGEVMSLVAKAREDGPAPTPSSSAEALAEADNRHAPSTDPSPLPPPPAEDTGSRKLPVLFWVGAGATVAAAGLGAGFWFAADSRADDFAGLNGKVAGGEIPPDDKQLLEARDDVERYDSVSLGMWIGAGVLAAATATVLIVHLTGDGDDAPPTGASLAPAPGGLAVRF